MQVTLIGGDRDKSLLFIPNNSTIIHCQRLLGGGYSAMAKSKTNAKPFAPRDDFEDDRYTIHKIGNSYIGVHHSLTLNTAIDKLLESYK